MLLQVFGILRPRHIQLIVEFIVANENINNDILHHMARMLRKGIIYGDQ